MTIENHRTRSEFKLGGKPLFAALLGVACGASPVPLNVIPLMIGPIHAEYGWDFALISGGMTIFGVLGALMAPLVGGASDKFGVRPVALISLFMFGMGFASLYFIPASPTGYLLSWAALGLIGIGSTPVTWSRAISMWFDKRRGLALGIMLLGTSLTALIVPQIAQRAIAAGGWRMGFPVVALLPLLIALPIGLAWFREPKPEERPASMTGAGGALWGLKLREAINTYRFWALFGSILLVAFAYGGAHIHMAQIVQLHGFSADVAAGIMSVVAIGILTGRLLIGFLFDRLWAPGVAFPALIMPAMACWILIGTTTTLPFIMMAAFLLGFAAGAESDVIAFLAAKYFGMAHYGRIYGVLYMPFGIGAAISPIVYGMVRDRTGGYDPMLMADMALFVTGGVLLLTLGRYPAHHQNS
ncbi:MFS transporter [Sphingobium boeckii]|uniref:MFS family permease n=1 Tax=Sphingobium boeckii TaxID=1082345 RepID=A0A7W9AJL0_9SPHN|nr:MFS transporter [Sphingobium boeckii]MBB5686903.1 MFS family permease [Sphingobium boeckii]